MSALSGLRHIVRSGSHSLAPETPSGTENVAPLNALRNRTNLIDGPVRLKSSSEVEGSSWYHGTFQTELAGLENSKIVQLALAKQSSEILSSAQKRHLDEAELLDRPRSWPSSAKSNNRTPSTSPVTAFSPTSPPRSTSPVPRSASEVLCSASPDPEPESLTTTRALATLVTTQSLLAEMKDEVANLRTRIEQHEIERESMWKRQEMMEAELGKFKRSTEAGRDISCDNGSGGSAQLSCNFGYEPLVGSDRTGRINDGGDGDSARAGSSPMCCSSCPIC